MAAICYPKLSENLAQSVCQVLENMMGLQATVTQESEGELYTLPADISSIIGLTASQLSGTVTLHCTEKLGTVLTTAMLGEGWDAGAADPISDLRDALGEVTNIVVGGFKVSLSEIVGEAVRMTVPTVIVGRAHTTRTIAKGRSVVVKLDVQGETLVLELVLNVDKGAALPVS